MPLPTGGVYPYCEKDDGTREHMIPRTHELRAAIDELRNWSYTFDLMLRHFAEEWAGWMACETGGEGKSREPEGEQPDDTRSCNEEQDGNNGGGAKTTQVRRPKCSTTRGAGRTKLTAALTKHHQYHDGSCSYPEPINNNALAEQAGVSRSTASAFFGTQFGGHEKYVARCRRNLPAVALVLKSLNGELTGKEILYGRRPPDEGDRDEE